jgi:hypothetical protein
MMTFEAINNRIAVATNSLKPVEIVRSGTGPYGRNTWMLYTPEGGLNDDFTSRGPFVSFEAAKRNAEMNVGMTIRRWVY